jgi:hypothetical protein
MPMFIPKRVVYLSSSIAHYERWFLMRADFVAPPFASEPRPHLTKRCSEPRTVLMPGFESMRTSFLARAVADLVSR